MSDSPSCSLAPDACATILTAVGSGQPVWEHLSNSPDCARRPASRAAFRGTCRALKDLADQLITQVSNLELGQAAHDNGPSQDHALPAGLFEHWPADWPVSETQRLRCQAFLQRLISLQDMTVVLQRSGTSQLLRLVQDGCFPSRLKRLTLKPGVHRHNPKYCWRPEMLDGMGFALASALPHLQHLRLAVSELPPGFLSKLAVCSNLRSLELDGTRLSLEAEAELSLLTQLTKLCGNTISRQKYGEFSMALLQPLQGLQHLHLNLFIGGLLLSNPDQLAILGKMTNLRVLELRSYHRPAVAASDFMAALRNLPELQDLTVTCFRLSEMVDGVEHLHLTRLAVQAENWQPAPRHRTTAFRWLTLQVLELQDSQGVALDVMHCLLWAAPSLRRLRLHSIMVCRSFGVNISMSSMTEQLREVAQRVADMGGVSSQDPSNPWTGLFLRFIDAASCSVSAQLLAALHPLSRIAEPALALAAPRQATPISQAAVSSLAAAIPNLHTLRVDVSSSISLMMLTELTQLQVLHTSSTLVPPDPYHGLDALGLQAVEAMKLKHLRAWLPAADKRRITARFGIGWNVVGGSSSDTSSLGVGSNKGRGGQDGGSDCNAGGSSGGSGARGSQNGAGAVGSSIGSPRSRSSSTTDSASGASSGRGVGVDGSTGSSGRSVGLGVGGNLGTLRSMELLEREIHLQDLHYFLRAAPNLEQVSVPEFILIPSPSTNPEIDTRTIAAMLRETLSMLALAGGNQHVGLPSPIPSPAAARLDFGRQAHGSLVPLMQALQPLSRCKQGYLTLKCLPSFPAAAAQALVQALPELQDLELYDCQVDGAALQVLAQAPSLHSLMMYRCDGPAAQDVMSLQLAAPRAAITVADCCWWTGQHQQELVKQTVDYWSSQV